jgi:hypothetical protein
MKRDQIAKIEGDSFDWAAYWSELWLHQRRVRGRSPYLPSPTDIQARCIDVLWLEECGFPRHFIVNVMEYDNPTIERVRQMVLRYGPSEAYRRCRSFLIETEYDGEKRCQLR